MVDYETQQKVLNSPFSIETHKKTFTCYTELVITEDGIAHYAVPSHNEFLIKMCCNKLNMTRDEVMDYIWNKGKAADYVEYMIELTNTILVWYGGYKGTPNDKQKDTIQALIDNGLMVDI